MKLKVKAFKLKAGRPIAFIDSHDAKVLDLHPGDRIQISCREGQAIGIVDIVSGFFTPGLIGLSQDIIETLKAHTGEEVDVQLISKPQSAKMLQRLVCKPYAKRELRAIIEDVISNALSEPEIAHFVSGVYHCGMSERETIFLTETIVETGKRLTWKSKLIADKHSIGGIPGNRTTPIVVAICAVAGIIMPKTSSRAITSAAGTADVVECIAKVDFSLADLRRIVSRTGACLAWGGALGLAPADDKLIQVEKILNLDPEPQLLASILAKKLSVGSKFILIDIPAGPGAKVSHEEARKLGEKFVRIGKKLKLSIKVVITDGKQPIGNGIGPMLEIKDVIRVLKRENSPLDLERKSVMLAGLLLEMLGKAKEGKGKRMAQDILNSGKAFEKFKDIIEAQKGNLNKVREAPRKQDVLAKVSGTVVAVDNKEINYLARVLGSPQDKQAGLYIYKHIGDKVKKGEPLITFHAQSKDRLRDAVKRALAQHPFTIK